MSVLLCCVVLCCVLLSSALLSSPLLCYAKSCKIAIVRRRSDFVAIKAEAEVRQNTHGDGRRAQLGSRWNSSARQTSIWALSRSIRRRQRALSLESFNWIWPARIGAVLSAIFSGSVCVCVCVRKALTTLSWRPFVMLGPKSSANSEPTPRMLEIANEERARRRFRRRPKSRPLLLARKPGQLTHCATPGSCPPASISVVGRSLEGARNRFSP